MVPLATMSEQAGVFPEVVLVEGESKTMKTSASKAAACALEDLGLRVARDDAGSFFRKTTVATLENLDRYGVEQPTQADYDQASLDVLDAGIPYDTQRSWELHTKRVDSVVSIVSRAKHVQVHGREWWHTTADRAVAGGADALVLDGRNPRARMESWLEKCGAPLVLELFCVCDPRIAARRTLHSRDILHPTAQQVREETASIAKRRQQDRQRTELPYEDPKQYVYYGPRSLPAEVVRQAVDLSEVGMPLPIRIDTGKLEFEPMNELMAELARSAHRFGTIGANGI